MARFVRVPLVPGSNEPVWINLDLVRSITVRTTPNGRGVLFEFDKDHGLLARAESDTAARELIDLLGLD